MSTSRFLISTLLLSLAVAPGCDSKKAADGEKAEKADDKKADAKKGDEKKADDKAAAKPAEEEKAPSLDLTTRDITADVSAHFVGFKGSKIEMDLPEGATLEKMIGSGFTAKLDPKVFAVEVGSIHPTKKVVADIEGGKSLLKEAVIVEKGEGFVIQKGSYMGAEGHSLNFDLPPVGGLVTGCRTPTGRLYPEATVRKALEACKSFKVTK